MDYRTDGYYVVRYYGLSVKVLVKAYTGNKIYFKGYKSENTLVAFSFL